jgi:hypothetical protein
MSVKIRLGHDFNHAPTYWKKFIDHIQKKNSALYLVPELIHYELLEYRAVFLEIVDEEFADGCGYLIFTNENDYTAFLLKWS